MVSSVRGGDKISSGGDYARWSWWREVKLDARGAAAGARTR